MARNFEKDSSEGLLYTINNGMTFSNGFSLSVWINPESVDTTNKRIIYIATGGTLICQVQLDNGTAGEAQANFKGDDDSNCFRETTAGAIGSNGTWEHFVCTHDGSRTSTNLRFYSDGSETGYTTDVDGTGTTRDAAASDTIAVGYNNVGSAQYYDGLLAELAIWDKVISAGEIAALSKGLSPKIFAPNFHIPLIRDTHELFQASSVSETGTTVSPHPPVIYPNPLRLVSPFDATPPAVAQYRRRLIISLPG
ncbi:MAG: LamG domain-containing protein [Planctomycetota bacterium]|jgi:hypothetical protein